MAREFENLALFFPANEDRFFVYAYARVLLRDLEIGGRTARRAAANKYHLDTHVAAISRPPNRLAEMLHGWHTFTFKDNFPAKRRRTFPSQLNLRTQLMIINWFITQIGFPPQVPKCESTHCRVRLDLLNVQPSNAVWCASRQPEHRTKKCLTLGKTLSSSFAKPAFFSIKTDGKTFHKKPLKPPR